MGTIRQRAVVGHMRYVLCLLVSFSATQAFLLPQKAGSADLPSLISQFSSTRDLEAKERILNEITTSFPDSGPALLQLAETTTDADTKWMAIRGIGTLKYKEAAPFLVKSLLSEYPYVRANSARALGDMKEYSAGQALITLLRGEQDGGVIEQTSLALRMIGAKEAVPVLKSKASHPSIQTRVWIFQAIGDLGSKDDVSFLAGHLYNENLAASMSAAQAIERITGIDFGFPKQQGPSGIGEEGVKNARLWWEARKSSWGPASERETPKR
jgi:HEAT repeat protein